MTSNLANSTQKLIKLMYSVMEYLLEIVSWFMFGKCIYMFLIYKIVFTGQPNLWLKSLQGKCVLVWQLQLDFVTWLITSAVAIKRTWDICF